MSGRCSLICLFIKNLHKKVDSIGEDDQHLGIDGMKERAKLFGGELTVESENNLGTVVKFYIPITNN